MKWTEQEYERGSLASTSRWTAMVTVRIQPPRNAESLRKNPLGLYVDAIDWSRELETPASPAPAASPPTREAPAFAPAPPAASVPQGSPLDLNLAAEPANQLPPSERNAQ